MPTCSAYGCSNKSGVAKGKSFFKIPDPKENSELCKRWLHNIGNANLTIKRFVASPNRVVYSDHFRELCLKRDIRSELCPSFKKCIKLVPGAIPTIFGYRTFDQINIDGTVCHIRRPPKRSLEEKRDMSSYSSSKTCFQEISKNDLVILGDGRFDSPGKSAKYCTYTCQSPVTKRIIATTTIQTSKGKGSSPLELEGFKSCLHELESYDFRLKSIATDRNAQITKWLRENRVSIEHCFDCCHFWHASSSEELESMSALSS